MFPQRIHTILDQLRRAVTRLPEFRARVVKRLPELPERFAAFAAAARRHLPRGLKCRLTSVAVGIAVVVMILTHLTLSRTAGSVAAEDAKKRATKVASCFADVVSEAIAARDRMQVQLVAAAFQRHDVCAVAVADTTGKPLYTTEGFALKEASASPSESVEAGSPQSSERGQQEFLLATRDVTFGGVPVGTVKLILDRSDLEASIRSANVPVFAVVSLGFVVLTVLGLVCLHSPFLALRKLTHAARLIGEGDLSARVPVNGSDEVAAFCSVFNSMVEGLIVARQETVSKQLEAVHAMINSVEAKDQYTAGHCLRVSNYAKEILKRHCDRAPLQDFLMQTAALLHDLGKLGIPDRILLKTDKLTPGEAKIIQSHVTIGAEILGHIDSLKDVARWIRHHHERWDGFGYPDGLAGEAIPFPSRVIAVADAVDAMLTDRPYRKALSIEATIDILKKNKGTQFDPVVVDLAMAHLEEKQHENSNVSDADIDRLHERGLQLV